MKKLLVAVMLMVGCLSTMNAQPRAIGGVLGYGLEFSYQHSMGESNMLSLDLGIPAYSGVGVVGTYDWIFPIKAWKEAGSWNWYVGAGAGLNIINSYFGFGVAGRIGVEYNFGNIPLQLSVDYRPVVGPYFGDGGVGFNSYGAYAGGIGVRYRF